MNNNTNTQIQIPNNVGGQVLQKTDFESELLYKVYIYMIKMV